MIWAISTIGPSGAGCEQRITRAPQDTLGREFVAESAQERGLTAARFAGEEHESAARAVKHEISCLAQGRKVT